jgi:hypothetical protein
MDYQQQIAELLDEVEQLGHGSTKVHLLQRAIQIADLHNDIAEGFELRIELIDAATFAGYVEKSLVAFPWCLAQYDRDPQNFSEHEIFWRYKWVCEGLPRFPQVAKEQIQATLMDFADRYRRSGRSLRPYWQLKTIAAILMGDRPAAIESEQKWQETELDSSYSDCKACELDWKVNFLIYVEEYERALIEAVPIVQGRLHCSEIPHHTLATLLMPLLKLDRIDEAREFHRKGYQLATKNPDFLKSVGEHLYFLVATGDLMKAVGLLEKHLQWALAPVDPWSQLYFYQASYLLLKSLQENNESTIKLRLPRSFPSYPQDGSYDLSLLVDWFGKSTQELATRFDRRNGNEYYQNQLLELDRFRMVRQQRSQPKT